MDGKLTLNYNNTMVTTKSMNLSMWINQSTANTNTVVEFGSMFFDKLMYTASPNKIGIEIHQPYIDNSTFHDCKKISGDFRNFEELVDKSEMDCAMFIDTLEHITREEAFELMGRVMKNFNRVILMIPEGNHPMDEDVTGHEGHEWQTHRSTWYAKDLIELGFHEDNIILDPVFHSEPGRDTGCLFATWSK